jgi:hypothetical protein
VHTILASIAVAAALVAILAGRRVLAFEASIWLAAAILGQAAALQLIDAGPIVRYQHFRPLTELFSGRFNVAVALVAIQAMSVAIRLYTLGDHVRSLVSRSGPLRPRQWMALTAIFVGTSATVSREPSVYAQELFIGTVVQLVNVATIAVFALTLPVHTVEWVRTAFNRVFNEGGIRSPDSKGIDRFAVGCAVWVVLLAIVFAYFAYERHPHIPDEVGYIYHARYFAQAMLTMPSPPVPAAFDLDLLLYEPGRWYSPVPPGWPAMLAVGARFGLEWFVNPLLAGINVLLASLLIRRLYDKRMARLACVLLCVSPWHIFMAMNFMTHTFNFTCLLVSALCVQRMRTTGSAWLGIPGGIALALISFTRPLDGFTNALAIGAWSLSTRGKWFRFAPSLVLTLVTIVAGSAQLAYNAQLTGSATTFPIMKYFDVTYYPGVNQLGFGADRGNLNWPHDPFPGHGLRDILVNTNLNLTAVNIDLFGWAEGSLLLLTLFLISSRMTRTDLQLVTLIILTLGMQSLYWFSGGPDFGARYWFTILLPVIVLSVRGVDWLIKRVESIASDELAGMRILLGIAAMVIAGVITFFPWRAMDKYYHYRGMRPDVRTLSTATPFGRSIIFVRGNRAPDYASAAIYNPIDLTADAPIFVWDRDPGVRKQVLSVYSGRPVWFLDGPTVTGRGFEIAGGPMRGEEAAKFPSRTVHRE